MSSFSQPMDYSQDPSIIKTGTQPYSSVPSKPLLPGAYNQSQPGYTDNQPGFTPLREAGTTPIMPLNEQERLEAGQHRGVLEAAGDKAERAKDAASGMLHKAAHSVGLGHDNNEAGAYNQTQTGAYNTNNQSSPWHDRTTTTTTGSGIGSLDNTGDHHHHGLNDGVQHRGVLEAAGDKAERAKDAASGMLHKAAVNVGLSHDDTMGGAHNNNTTTTGAYNNPTTITGAYNNPTTAGAFDNSTTTGGYNLRDRGTTTTHTTGVPPLERQGSLNTGEHHGLLEAASEKAEKAKLAASEMLHKAAVTVGLAHDDTKMHKIGDTKVVDDGFNNPTHTYGTQPTNDKMFVQGRPTGAQ